MGTYYHVKDNKSEQGFRSVHEDDYIRTLFSISKKHGIKINDEMILAELDSKLDKNTSINK